MEKMLGDNQNIPEPIRAMIDKRHKAIISDYERAVHYASARYDARVQAGLVDPEKQSAHFKALAKVLREEVEQIPSLDPMARLPAFHEAQVKNRQNVQETGQLLTSSFRMLPVQSYIDIGETITNCDKGEHWHFPPEVSPLINRAFTCNLRMAYAGPPTCYSGAWVSGAVQFRLPLLWGGIPWIIRVTPSVEAFGDVTVRANAGTLAHAGMDLTMAVLQDDNLVAWNSGWVPVFEEIKAPPWPGSSGHVPISIAGPIDQATLEFQTWSSSDVIVWLAFDLWCGLRPSEQPGNHEEGVAFVRFKDNVGSQYVWFDKVILEQTFHPFWQKFGDEFYQKLLQNKPWVKPVTWPDGEATP